MWFAWWNLPRLRQILVLAGDKGRRGWTKHDSTPFRFQLYCQNMCGPANAHCLSMFCQGCILMYFTSDQRNFLEFGNVCPNQNFVYCDKPCGCKVAERNIMSCNVGMQFFCNASNLIRWLWTAFSDSRELSMYEAVSQHVVDDVKYIVCNPGNTVWECAFGLHVYSSIEFNARQCSAMWWHVLQCNFIWYQ